MEIPLLRDVIILFGVAIGVLVVCHRLRVPSVVGFLLTGILVGPFGLGLIGAIEEVKILAELGVVLLLFTIGIEFSLKNLLQIKKSVILGGSLQLVLTLLAVFVIFTNLKWAFGESLFIGFLVSLSSTAIVLKVLQEKAEIESPHGRLSLAVLIFQDMAVVPMMLFVPLLAGATGQLRGPLIVVVAKGIGIIFMIAVGAKWIVPHLLYQIARTRSRELFLFSVLVICFGVAWFTYSLGLSLALGAFLAGLIISESEYSHQTLSNILPFRDVFTSIFFVSIGMLLDLRFLIHQAGQVGLFAIAVMALKGFLACLAVLVLGFPLRTGIVTGLTLSQIGEFSFVLSTAGAAYGLITSKVYHLFLAVTVVTMGATPFIIGLAPRLADFALRLPLPKKLKRGFFPLPAVGGFDRPDKLRDHLIIVGFGLNGKNLARAARKAGIPYVIIETNPETVREQKKAGEPIFYGDATHDPVLEHAGIKHARVIVLVISDAAATRRITSVARRLCPRIRIIARTRFVPEMIPLYESGADEVIPEEFETSVEIFARVLAKYLISRDEIERFIAEVRADGYEMLRSLSKNSTSLYDLKLHLPDLEINTFRVSERSPVIGKSLSEIELRKKFGVTVLAIHRDKQILSGPDGNTRLHAGDVLVIIGPPPKLAGIIGLFTGAERWDKT